MCSFIVYREGLFTLARSALVEEERRRKRFGNPLETGGQPNVNGNHGATLDLKH